MTNSLKLKIYGQVQGVGFRWSIREQAQNLELTGWVKNCSDGRVEVVIEGLDENLKNFLTWCYNGNSIAKVEKIEEEWGKASDKYKEFEII